MEFYLLANKEQSETSGQAVIKVTVFTAQFLEGLMDLIQTFEMEATHILPSLPSLVCNVIWSTLSIHLGIPNLKNVVSK